MKKLTLSVFFLFCKNVLAFCSNEHGGVICTDKRGRPTVLGNDCASCDVGDASPGTFGIWLLDTSLCGVLFVFGSAILPYVGSVGGFGVP